MDAVEFYRQFARYCSSSYCSECTIVESCKTKGKDGRDADKIVRTIEQWAKDNPIKTRQSEFLKMFPNANINSFTDTFCVAHFDKTKTCKASAPTDEMCEKCRDAYWLTEVTDNGNVY